MNKILVKLILLFRPLWNRMGVNADQLEIILLTKLKMDGRRVSSFNRNTAGKKKNNRDLMTMFYFFVLGFFCMTILVTISDPVSAIAVYLMVWIVFLSLTLISDFTDVLIDVRDNYILLPRPVNNQTLAVSRLMHVFLYLFRLVIPFSIPGIVYIAANHGLPGGLLFGIQIFLTVIFAIFLVNIIYLIMLRLTTQQRFKEIINYFQIGFTITIMTGYYILPRLVDFSKLETLNVMEMGWTYILPSVWIANIWGILMDWNFSFATLLLSGLGVLMPIVALYLVSTVLSKGFSQKLMGLGQGSESKTKTPETEPKDKSNNKLLDWWNNLITKSPTEKVGFKMSWIMTARSRDYKLKTYPLFGFIPAMFIYFALNGEGTLAERWQGLLESDQYILLIYICIYATIVPVLNLKYSERHQSSWIFYALPIEQPGLFIKGAIKSILARFIAPIFLFSSILVLAMWGFNTLDDILVGAINVLLITALVGKGILKTMPFTESWTTQNKGSNFMWSFGIIFLLGGLGLTHWAMSDQPLVLLGWALIAFGLMWYSFSRFDGIKWSELE